MKQFLNAMTNNSIGLLKKPLLLEILQSVLQGQPYFVILMVMLEFLKPLENPGTELNSVRLILLTTWLGAALLLLFFVGKGAYNLEHSAAYTVAAEGRLALGDHLRKLSMGFFKGRDPGDITALMLQDYTNVETMLSHLMLGAIGALVLPVVFLVFLLPLDWRMALITLLPIPAALASAMLTRKIILRVGNKHVRAKNNAASRMLEYLDGIKNIKAFNLHGKKFFRMKNTFNELRRQSIRLEALSGPSVFLGVWALNAGIALIMLSGTFFVMNGSLSVASFLFFLVIGTRMYDPLTTVLSFSAELSYYSLSVSRIKDVYAIRPLPEAESARRPARHDVEFRSVWFHYHDTDVLKDVSFTLRENTMTALVGPSGSGKSTITRLIARFWDVDRGEIRIGGLPVTGIPTDGLLSMISMVFQDVYLFNDTILANIQVGRADASMEEVLAAAGRARCREFIEKLPAGYDTMVGEGGATLSGGEKQRISIARAILKDAPIILLDEATASLDPENELYIQQAIGELVRGRTLIVIAHRLSTITHADQILVLKDGSIEERGTHDELLRREGGLYQGMWNEQKAAHKWKVGGRKL